MSGTTALIDQYLAAYGEPGEVRRADIVSQAHLVLRSGIDVYASGA
jgi:hypothetical protein